MKIMMVPALPGAREFGFAGASADRARHAKARQRQGRRLGHADANAQALGKCEPPFTMAAQGHRAGDMPNLHIPVSGEFGRNLERRYHAGEGQAKSVFDAVGRLVIHAIKGD
jgi:hypothetical protein